MKTIIRNILMSTIGIFMMFMLTGCPKSDGKNGEFSFENLLMSTPDNVSPVAHAGVDQVTIIGSVITLDGTESYDEDGDIVSYEWLSADGTTLGNGAVLAISTLTFPAGVYEVTLLVTDDEGATHLDSLIITIHIPPSPTPPPTPAPEPTPAPAPEMEEEPEPTPEPVVNTAPVAKDVRENPGATGGCFSGSRGFNLDASDADGDTLTYIIVTQPASGTVTTTGGALALYTNTSSCFVPGTDLPLIEDTFTYKVNDGKVDSNIATVTLDFRIFDL